MSGWLKLWRKWLSHELARDPKAWLVMTHLLCRAAIEPRVNRRFGYTLQPGQCDDTQEQLSDGAGLTRDEVREALRRLMRYGTIEIHPAHTGHNSQPNPQRRNVITLVNWASYNGDGTSTPKDAPNESPTAPPKNPQSIRSKEVREEKPKRASRAGVDPTAAIIPDNLKGSEQAIRAWLNYKREKGQGYQPEGLRAFFSKLSKLPDVPAAIEHSMASNYTGVYPPSGNGHSKIPMKVSPAYVGEDARYE